MRSGTKTGNEVTRRRGRTVYLSYCNPSCFVFQKTGPAYCLHVIHIHAFGSMIISQTGGRHTYLAQYSHHVIRVYSCVTADLPAFQARLRVSPCMVSRSRVPCRLNSHIHCKKMLSIFPSPAGMSCTKLSLAGNNLVIPGQGEFS